MGPAVKKTFKSNSTAGLISKELFEKAQALYEKESYSESTKILWLALDSIFFQSTKVGVPISEAIVLLGWNIAKSFDYSGLKDWEETIVTHGVVERPDFDLVRMWVLAIRGKTQEVIKRTTAFLEFKENTTHPLFPDFLIVRANAFSYAGKMDRVIQDGETAFSICCIQGRELESGRAANMVGIGLTNLGKYQKAQEWYSRTEKIFALYPQPRKQSSIALNKGVNFYKCGDFSKAIQFLKTSLKISNDNCLPHRQCPANIGLGKAYRMIREFSTAKHHLMLGLSLAKDNSLVRNEALALEALGELAFDEGQLAQAQSYSAEAMVIAKRIAPKGGIVSTINRLIGQCHANQYEHEQAKLFFRKALVLCRDQGNSFEEAVTLRAMAEAELLSGNPISALDKIIPACEIFEELCADYEWAIACQRHAETLLATRHDASGSAIALARLKSAWDLATDALKLFQKIEVSCWSTQAEGLVKQISVLLDEQERNKCQAIVMQISNEGTGYNPRNIINLPLQCDFSALESLEQSMSNLGNEEKPEWKLLNVWKHSITGEFSEAIKLATEFLDGQNNQIHPFHPDFYMIRGLCFAIIGNIQQPIHDFESAFSVFKIQGREFEAGKSANILGGHFLSIGQCNKALEWFSRAEKYFQDQNFPLQNSIVTLNLGLVHLKLGNFESSLKYLKKNFRTSLEKNWINHQCFTNLALGSLYRIKREYKKAKRHLMAAYSQAQEKSMAREESIALGLLGDVFLDEGHYSQSQLYYSRALVVAEIRALDDNVIAQINHQIGKSYSVVGDFAQAGIYLQTALELAQRKGDRFAEAVSLRVIAECDLAFGNPLLALKNIDTACQIFDKIGAKYELGIARLCQGEILLAGRHDTPEDTPALVNLNQAWHFATDALKLFMKTETPWWVSQANSLVKQIAAMRDQQEQRDRKEAAARSSLKDNNPNQNNAIIFKSMIMGKILDLCDLYATDHNPVLIMGETGTGKELIAHRLHRNSGRKGRFVPVNVASIAPTLFEREFFGHVKGSFSGADDSRIGFAEQADEGTLFLDEIGDLPLDLQPKLLRLLQNGTFHPIGDPAERKVDVRIVAASNKDLFKAKQNGTFREDLFYRLQVLTVNLPSMRDRRDDILLLMEYFLSREEGHQILVSDYLNPASEDLAQKYFWPGNVREIISVCHQLRLQVSAKGFSNVELGQPGNRFGVLCGPGHQKMDSVIAQPLYSTLDTRQRLLTALKHTKGNRKEAAKILGISRSTFYRRLREFDL
jgi:DNA-binding NtrC family response regulator/Tfp pilus assembly protein PilF